MGSRTPPRDVGAEAALFEGERVVGAFPPGGEPFDLSDPEAWERYWTDLREEGLTSREMRERYLSGIAGEAGIPIPELERRIEEWTPYWFFVSRAPERIPGTFEAFLSVGVVRGLAPKPRAWQIRGDSLIGKLRADGQINVERIAYSSSILDISPLCAEVAYDPAGRRMPIVVIQARGYLGSSRLSIIPSICRMARQGLFGVTVSKRGRDGSAGADRTDAWATEVHDIIDAIEHVKREYGEYVDPANINIWGYGGGGVDAISAVARFPDYFRFVGPYFGPFEWRTTLGSREEAYLGEEIEEGVHTRDMYDVIDDHGGPPSRVPDNWMVRDNLLAVVNNRYSHTLMFSDIEEGRYTPTLGQMKEYLATARKLGYTNIHLNVSDGNDRHRWWHAHPGGWDEGGNPDLFASEALFVPHILNGDYPAPVLARQGDLVVLGYLRTRRFSVWLGEGDNAVAGLSYELGGHEKVFRFERMTSTAEVRGVLSIPNPDRVEYDVFVNGRPAGGAGPETELEIGFDLDERIVIRAR